MTLMHAHALLFGWFSASAYPGLTSLTQTTIRTESYVSIYNNRIVKMSRHVRGLRGRTGYYFAGAPVSGIRCARRRRRHGRFCRCAGSPAAADTSRTRRRRWWAWWWYETGHVPSGPCWRKTVFYFRCRRTKAPNRKTTLCYCSAASQPSWNASPPPSLPMQMVQDMQTVATAALQAPSK